MKRLSLMATVLLVLLCAGCGGPEPKVYEMDIPGFGAEQDAGRAIVGVDRSEGAAEVVAAAVAK